MPNWCTNELTISHPDPAKVTELCEAYMAENLLDYAAPMPENIGLDWHHWRTENWGTKWDVSSNRDYVFASPNEIFLSFETAWGPPIGAYAALIDKGFALSAYYIEEGVGLLGRCYGSPGEGFTYIDCDIEGDIDADVAAYWINAITAHKERMAEQGGLTMDKIVTYYDAMDGVWVAYRETGQNDTEETPYGCGASEAAAIGDLHDKLVMGAA